MRCDAGQRQSPSSLNAVKYGSIPSCIHLLQLNSSMRRMRGHSLIGMSDREDYPRAVETARSLAATYVVNLSLLVDDPRMSKSGGRGFAVQ